MPPHSSTRGEGELVSAPVLFFDLAEPSLIIEVPARFRENAKPRFDCCCCCFCCCCCGGFGFGEVAAAIWLVARKSEKAVGVGLAGVKMGRGLSGSGGLGGPSTRVLVSITDRVLIPSEPTYQLWSPPHTRPRRRLARSDISWWSRPC